MFRPVRTCPYGFGTYSYSNGGQECPKQASPLDDRAPQRDSVSIEKNPPQSVQLGDRQRPRSIPYIVTNTTSMEGSPKFDTPSGCIIGWHDNGVTRATGIRYAHAVRFQPPTPVPRSSTPIVATAWSAASPQAPVPLLDEILGTPLIAHLKMDEHCQQLSITLPRDRQPVENLPVMIWIHGGSYKSGAGDAAVYDPSALVEEQEVIVVSVSYRLGFFGFLGGYAQRPANLGLLDLVEALRWIHNNISSFGGDAGNVTLFGHSAGGDAIAHLMIADGVGGLFHRVIIQSAPLGISRGRTEMTKALCRIAGGIRQDDSPADVVAKQDAITAAVKGFGLKAGMPFGTQYGHVPLPGEEEVEGAWIAKAPHYDVLIGCTKAETSLFLVRMKRVRQLTRMPVAGPLLKRLLVNVTTRRVYKRAAGAFARRHARNGGRVYLYNIHWGSRINDFGATHTIELPLLFGNPETWQHSQLLQGIPRSELVESGKRLRALWANFARAGHLDENDPTYKQIITYKRVGK